MNSLPFEVLSFIKTPNHSRAIIGLYILSYRSRARLFLSYNSTYLGFITEIPASILESLVEKGHIEFVNPPQAKALRTASPRRPKAARKEYSSVFSPSVLEVIMRHAQDRRMLLA